MKVNELGVQLIGDYRKIIRMSWARRENLEKLAVDKKDVDKLWGAYLGIEMISLGSISLGRVDLGGQPPRSTRPDAPRCPAMPRTPLAASMP